MKDGFLKTIISFLCQDIKILREIKHYRSIKSFSEKYAFLIKKKEKEDLVHKSFDFISNKGIEIITIWDDIYPKGLLDLTGPPAVLFVKGDVSVLDAAHMVGVVGSRKASAYGLNVSMSFSEDLAANGIVIVSGLARGIDTYAHKGALKSGGRTIAVIGSGFANIYPRENKSLARDMWERHGLVISEFPPFMPPLRQNFPRRNRIISGLSKCLLVIEAGKRSGALITANISLDLGREVFSLPGQINASSAIGTNSLIYDGATPLLSTQDVLECLGIDVHRKAANKSMDISGPVFEALKRNGSLSVDDICKETNLPITQVLNDIIKLELKGIVIRQGALIALKV